MKEKPVIEPFFISDVWCESLARIDRMGPCRRLVFSVTDPGLESTRVVVARLIMPAEVLADIAQMLAGDVQAPRHFAELSRAVVN